MSEPDRPLPPAARHQLVTIAADVMGHRPVSELPATIRRFARFAPAKRLRLGAAEIATALATEAGFRELVAEVAREASPELAGLVAAGHPPATADPADIAVLLYLLRPPEWQAQLAALSEQQAAADQQRADQGELAAQHAELEQLRQQNARLNTDRDRLRSEARAAASARDAELAELTRRVRTLTGEVRAARRAAERADAELARLRAETDQRAAGDAAELRRARSRIAELEATVEAARRRARGERDHDSARLWVLLETLGSAVTGLRQELAVTDPQVRPADLVAGGSTAIGQRPSTVTGDLLDRLLDGGPGHLIVDGYNLTKTGYGSLTLAEQRNRLVASLGPLAARTGFEVTVAFDGTAAPVGAAARLPTPRGVRVLFSPSGQLADDLIRQLLRAEPPGRLILVASSDGEVAASVRKVQAWSVPADVLLHRLQR